MVRAVYTAKILEYMLTKKVYDSASLKPPFFDLFVQRQGCITLSVTDQLERATSCQCVYR